MSDVSNEIRTWAMLCQYLGVSRPVAESYLKMRGLPKPTKVQTKHGAVCVWDKREIDEWIKRRRE
jgi:predicted DNA-binding transcriptional regulator AlpA